MDKKKLKEWFEAKWLSAEAYNVLDSLMDEVDSRDREVSESEELDLISEFVHNTFIYYSDAWKYLQEENITDFERAFKLGGFTDISKIAAYYLLEEIIDLFKTITGEV